MLPAFFLAQGVADYQNILNRGTFQCRTTGDFKVPPSIRPRCFAVSFGNVQRYRLTGAKPLLSRGPMDPIQVGGILINLGDITDSKAVNVQFFVSQCHIPISIPIPIAIPIWMALCVYSFLGETTVFFLIFKL